MTHPGPFMVITSFQRDGTRRPRLKTWASIKHFSRLEYVACHKSHVTKENVERIGPNRSIAEGDTSNLYSTEELVSKPV